MGTRYAGSERERRALDAFIKLRRASDSLAARLSPSYSAFGLTESQFGVLEALHHLGPLCQADLARKILKSGGNMTMVIDNLEKRKLVKRKRDEADRRYMSVFLTDEGRLLITEAFAMHLQAVVRELERLSPEEQETLGALCRKLGKTNDTRSE